MSIPKLAGVYKIRSKEDDRFYIGSTNNLYVRKREHFYKLRKNKHENKKLQNFYNKYGKDSLSFEAILFLPEDYIRDFEQVLLDRESPEFNIAPKVGSTTGYSHTKEDKIKMSEIKKEYYKKNDPWNKGRKVTKQEKENISKKLKAYYKNRPGTFTGRTHTEEAKKLMLAASKRRQGTHHTGHNGRVVKLDIETLEPVEIYSSCGHASNYVNSKGTMKTRRTKIAESIKHDRNAYGFKWAYEKDLDQTKLDELLETQNGQSAAKPSETEGSETT